MASVIRSERRSLRINALDHADSIFVAWNLPPLYRPLEDALELAEKQEQAKETVPL